MSRTFTFTLIQSDSRLYDSGCTLLSVYLTFNTFNTKNTTEAIKYTDKTPVKDSHEHSTFSPVFTNSS